MDFWGRSIPKKYHQHNIGNEMQRTTSSIISHLQNRENEGRKIIERSYEGRESRGSPFTSIDIRNITQVKKLFSLSAVPYLRCAKLFNGHGFTSRERRSNCSSTQRLEKRIPRLCDVLHIKISQVINHFSISFFKVKLNKGYNSKLIILISL
uniref:Uncharacterized protein n=1 Tax=Gossypium raimondii TaxID=29730 RepID=A0A0D2VSZ3_GOSRA|nr:hypothetical protein B456_011G288500 [Gossypium raimondii]